MDFKQFTGAPLNYALWYLYQKLCEKTGQSLDMDFKKFTGATDAYKLWYIFQKLDALDGTSISTVSPPANNSDMSVLPGGVVPAVGKSFLAFDENGIWTIKNPETSWKYTDRSAV